MRFIGARVGSSLLTLLGSSLVIFLVVRLIPGDPIAIMLERFPDPTIVASMRALYGLDLPMHEQFLNWLKEVLSGNLGYSILTKTPVIELVGERLPATVYLMVGGLIVGLALAIPLAIVAATRAKRWPDSVVTAVTTIFLSVPSFWIAYLLIIVFAGQLRLLPATGYVDPAIDPVGFVRSMILPSVALGVGMAAFVARVLRSSLLDVLGQDFIRTARARGVSEAAIVGHHALRPAAIPAITVVGLEIGYLVGGAIVIERVFAYPGMGTLIVRSIGARDYPVVQAAVLLFAVGFIAVNLLTDLTYAVIDPRVRRR